MPVNSPWHTSQLYFVRSFLFAHFSSEIEMFPWLCLLFSTMLLQGMKWTRPDSNNWFRGGDFYFTFGCGSLLSKDSDTFSFPSHPASIGTAPQWHWTVHSWWVSNDRTIIPSIKTFPGRGGRGLLPSPRLSLGGAPRKQMGDKQTINPHLFSLTGNSLIYIL